MYDTSGTCGDITPYIHGSLSSLQNEGVSMFSDVRVYAD